MVGAQQEKDGNRQEVRRIARGTESKGDYAGLAKLPRNASPTRVVNRCSMSGRRHGYLRKFACSRMTFREGALNGLIPGVTKASW